MTGHSWWARIPASRYTVLLAVGAALAVNLSPARTLVPNQPGQLLLVLVVAGPTAGGAARAFALARLDDSRGIAGLAAAVTVYALVVLPATVIAFTSDGADHQM